MLGRQERWQEELFVAGSLSELIPEDHILKRVDKVLDLSWLAEEVSELYSESQGRPSIDPEAAVRLMLAGYFQGVVHDRKLMREAQVNLAIRWFAGYALHERLPDHSSLTRIRQRWGAERFKRIFQRTVRQCLAEELVNGETVHVDATLIRADVSWESLTAMHAEKVLSENEGVANETSLSRGRPRKPRSPKKRSTTDPEATLTTSSHDFRMTPSYKQHTAVDEDSGVIVDVEVTTGETSEGAQLLDQIDRIEATTQRRVKTVTADAAYAHPKNYERLEERGIDPIIPPQKEPRRVKKIPIRRFKYDSRHQRVRCPGGKCLERRSRVKNGWLYRAKAKDCRACALQSRCVAPSAKTRSILIVDGYEALLRARRRKPRWDAVTKDHYRRHRWRVEGVHGEAKTQHGLRRAVRRGLSNVAIQVYLTAITINLKRLAACSYTFFRGFRDVWEGFRKVGHKIFGENKNNNIQIIFPPKPDESLI